MLHAAGLLFLMLMFLFIFQTLKLFATHNKLWIFSNITLSPEVIEIN